MFIKVLHLFEILKEVLKKDVWQNLVEKTCDENYFFKKWCDENYDNDNKNFFVCEYVWKIKFIYDAKLITE